MTTGPDHLVLGCATLTEGIEHVERLTGATAVPGGKHVTMGTHNALVRLGPALYLEILAIDPDTAPPARPRWFDLDSPALQSALADKPQLIGWVAHTDDIDDALMRVTIAPGVAHAFTRGDYAWRLTVPDDGVRPERGVIPGLIQWAGKAHPCDALADSGVALAQFAASHPDPARIREALHALKLGDTLQVTYAAVPRIAAMLRTRRGLVSI